MQNGHFLMEHKAMESTTLLRQALPWTIRRRALQVVAAVWATFFAAVGVVAQEDSEAEPIERPAVAELLPENTLAYVQVSDVLRLRESIRQSAFGQMTQDESMAPFVEGLYGEAEKAYDDFVREEVGDIGLSELAAMPNGEICFAMVAQRRKDPAVVFVMDTDPESDVAGRLEEAGRLRAEAEGAELEDEVLEDENLEGLQIRSLTPPAGDDNSIYYFEQQGRYVICSSRDLLIELATRAAGTYEGEVRAFTENRKFATVMNRCRGTKEAPPEIAFYVDPIELIRELNRSNVGVKTALAFLPYVGVDGLLAVGGSAIYNEEGYDSIFHLHILMASPRKGFLDLISLKPGFNDPEAFVPADVISYATSNWNVPKTWKEIGDIYDIFTEDGAFEEALETPNEFLGIDLEKDLIDTLDGRLTLMTWPEPPARLNSQSFAGAIKIKDLEKFEETLEVLLARLADFNEDALEENRLDGVTFWSEPIVRLEERQQQFLDRNEEGVELNVRLGSPCFGIIGDYLVITESRKFFEEMVKVYNGNAKPLGQDEDYTNMIREMERNLGTQAPSVTFFNRPAEQMRVMFEVADSDNTRELLNYGAEENEYVKGLRNVFEDTPLPAFEDVERYFPPAGGFVTSDETGFHLMVFSLKPADEEEGD